MKIKTIFYRVLVISICLIIMMMIGLNIYSYAQITEGTDVGKIIVSNIEAGATVSAYKLTKVNYDYTADQPKSTPYTWESGILEWVTENYSEYENIENFYNSVQSKSDEAEAFYNDLALAIKGNSINGITPVEEKNANGTASYPVTEEKLTGSVEFENCKMGTYLILIENGYRVYTPSVVNLTPEYNSEAEQPGWELASEVNVEVKSTNPGIKKTVTNDSLQKDSYGTNDKISFKLKADVPTYLTGSKSNKYYISDILDDGLVLNKESIKVSGQKGDNTPVVLNSVDDYTLTTESAKRPDNDETAVDFLIEFQYARISTYDSIIVEYETSLNRNNTVVLGGLGNSNIAYLDYSNNPYQDSSIQTQESTSTVYTYGAEITKVDKNNANTKLSGAEFTLSKNNAKMYFIKTTTEGVYYLANETDEGATDNLVVDQNGKLCLYGLDIGTYSLTETKAPAGYNKATTSKTIEIVDDDLDGSLNGGTTGIYTGNFENGQGFQLPVTGGSGTVIFVTTGIVFIGLGIIILIVVMRKQNKKSKIN